MPLALAIETSGRIGSLALVDHDDRYQSARILSEQSFPHGLQHAAQIIPLIDSLCRSHSATPRDLRTVFLSTGPGSFTGLRIAITLAKSLAFSTAAKIVSVPTLDVLAQNAPTEVENLIILLDAKRDQIFTARFQRTDSALLCVEPPHLDTLAAMLSRAPRPVHLLGEGIPFHEKFLPKNDPSLLLTDPELWRARASALTHLALPLAAANQFADPYKLTPTYIRLPEAEEKWQQKNS
jgi:tRNA threonylcarbamoyladenosine biosynthesis protein TsaB